MADLLSQLHRTSNKTATATATGDFAPLLIIQDRFSKQLLHGLTNHPADRPEAPGKHRPDQVEVEICRQHKLLFD